MKLREVERKVYSQNGEDGIIEWLLDKAVGHAQGAFLEIGIGTGDECCTRRLANAGWRGVWVEADPKRARLAYERFHADLGVEVIQHAVTPSSAADVARRAFEIIAPASIEVLSVDTDGHCIFIAQACLSVVHPAVVVIEYNAAFGPTAPLSICPELPARSNFYYGAGVEALRRMMRGHGYAFLTVDSAGVNAIFYDPERVDIDRRPEDWLNFADCAALNERYGGTWEDRWGKFCGDAFEEWPACA